MFNNSSAKDCTMASGISYRIPKATKVTWSLPLCFCSVSQGERVPNSLDHHPLLSFGTSLHRLLMFWPALQDLFRGCLEPLGFCWARRGSGIDTRCSLAKAVKPAAGFLHARNVCIRGNSITKQHLAIVKISIWSTQKRNEIWLVLTFVFHMITRRS